MLNWIWPDINDIEDAKKVCNEAAAFAFFVASVTAVVVYVQNAGLLKVFEAVGPYAYLDAGLFFAIGIGLLKRSRIAACLSILLYALEQYYMIRSGAHGVSLIMIFIALGFINGVRGSFAYHDMMKQMDRVEDVPAGSILHGNIPRPPEPKSNQEARTWRFERRLIIPVAVLGVIAALATIFFFSPLRHRIMKGEKDTPLATEAREFHLKNGKVIRGQIVYEDETYYTVKTLMGQEIIVKQDLQGEPRS